MRHIPSQYEKIEAWRMLRRKFRPEKAARLLGSSNREMSALEQIYFPPEPKVEFEDRVELVKKFLDLTRGPKHLSGNQAAHILGKSASWFSVWVRKYIRNGEGGLKIERQKHELG